MQYKILSIGDPRLAKAGVIRDGTLFGPTDFLTAPIAFGDTDPALLRLPEPEDAAEWPARTQPLAEVPRYRIANAIVHLPHGIITVNDMVVEETLGHIPFHLDGYGRDAETVTLPDRGVAALIANAVHVMGGNHANYFHWLTDILPKAQVAPLGGTAFNGTVLLPPPVSKPIAEIASLMARSGLAVYAPGEFLTQVQTLLYHPNLFSWGFAPNPNLSPFFDTLRHSLGVVAAPHNKIYITRRDTNNRRLLNEDQVIDRVQAVGYAVVELSGLTMTAQARIFAGASHIISPHGAGLANLVFCEPGVTVCELQMDAYLNWCFRRIAGLRHLKYGCVIGAAEPNRTAEWIHDTSWTLPIAKMDAVLAVL